MTIRYDPFYTAASMNVGRVEEVLYANRESSEARVFLANAFQSRLTTWSSWSTVL